MQNNILQSKAWLDFQASLGKKTFHKKSLRSDDSPYFEYFAIKENTRLGSYLFAPYGPLIDEKSKNSSLKFALESLKSLAKSENCFFIRIEPRYKYTPSLLKSFGLKKSKDLNPKETWILDLTGDEADLKSRLPSRLLRYYKRIEKDNLEIKTSKNPSDLDYLISFQSALAREKSIKTYDKSYYEAQLRQDFSTLYLLKNRSTGEVLASGLVLDDKHTRYNLQGAQTEAGRKAHATGILTIQLILDAKEKAKKTFDFWGIAPEGSGNDHPWAGFTGFKKTFSGHEVDYSGDYDLIISPLKYKLYSLLRVLNRKLRK